MGQFKEDGIITVTDLRIGAILSFYNEKKFFITNKGIGI